MTLKSDFFFMLQEHIVQQVFHTDKWSIQWPLFAKNLFCQLSKVLAQVINCFNVVIADCASEVNPQDQWYSIYLRSREDAKLHRSGMCPPSSSFLCSFASLTTPSARWQWQYGWVYYSFLLFANFFLFLKWNFVYFWENSRFSGLSVDAEIHCKLVRRKDKCTSLLRCEGT